MARNRGGKGYQYKTKEEQQIGRGTPQHKIRAYPKNKGMTLESQRIPNLNAPDEEWKKYWDSCNIGGIASTLEKLVQMDRKNRPIENKSLYMRALECKELLGKIFLELIDKNNKLIKDIEYGKN